MAGRPPRGERDLPKRPATAQTLPLTVGIGHAEGVGDPGTRELRGGSTFHGSEPRPATARQPLS